MKAIVFDEHGDIDVLAYRDIDTPELQPGEARIAVRACSLNYHDVFTRRGMPGIKVPLPGIPGCDAAGQVAELGPDVEGWSVGDRVLVDPVNRVKGGLMGETMHGGLAEYCLVAARQPVRMPDEVSFEQAAALPVAYGTAHRMMFENGGVAAGERVLVLGASGGVGSCCVLLAKLIGAEVVACGSTPEKLEALKSWGADHVIDYTETRFEREIWKLYEKPHRRRFTGGVDMVVNFTGGDTWVPSMKALKRGGRLMTCGATAGYDPNTDLRYIWTFELKVLGSNSWAPEDLTRLMALIQEGKLEPVIDCVLPLEETREGVRRLRDREVIGKIIIEP